MAVTNIDINKVNFFRTEKTEDKKAELTLYGSKNEE